MGVRRNRKTAFAFMTHSKSKGLDKFGMSKQVALTQRFTSQLSTNLFFKPCMIALLPTVIAVTLKWLKMTEPNLFFDGFFPENPLVYTSLCWVLGFLLVFRTSQAYTRYWDCGCLPLSKMSCQWFDACAQMVAFAETSGAPELEVDSFQTMTVKYFSLLHCCALQSVSENTDKTIEVIDMLGIDSQRLAFLQKRELRVRPEIVVQWIQTSLLAAIGKGIVKTPPPIVSRVFQELNDGLTHLQEMTTVAENPFPFAYSQMCLSLLVFYTIITPFFAASLTNARGWAGTMAFIAVFVMWTIQSIAKMIEQPFGDDIDDLDVETMQRHLNEKLAAVLDPMARTPIELKKLKNNTLRAKTRVTAGRLEFLSEECEEREIDDVEPLFAAVEERVIEAVEHLFESPAQKHADEVIQTGGIRKVSFECLEKDEVTNAAGVTADLFQETVEEDIPTETPLGNETDAHAPPEPNADDAARKGQKSQNLMPPRKGSGMKKHEQAKKNEKEDRLQKQSNTPTSVSLGTLQEEHKRIQVYEAESCKDASVLPKPVTRRSQEIRMHKKGTE